MDDVLTIIFANNKMTLYMRIYVKVVYLGSMKGLSSGTITVIVLQLAFIYCIYPNRSPGVYFL